MSKKYQRWIKRASGILALLVLGFVLVPLPEPLFNRPYSTILRGADGTLLSAAIADDQQWRFPASDSISHKFNVAIRLFEDEYFNYHLGVNPVSIARAVRQNISAGKVVSGGSTISMQTVRLAYGNKPRSYLQKVLEMLAATKLEFLYDKEAILQLYAVHAPFGGNIVGINSASWRYYGRSPHQLSWAETATMAVLPNDPASIFPGRNQESLLTKRNFLLEKIHKRGFMDDDALFLAKQEPLPGKVKPMPSFAYHLLHRSREEGHVGTSIRSTLHPRLQVAVKQKVERYSNRMAANQIHNAAAVVIEIESGNALAYVGNTDNPGDHGQHVDVVTARRSPGSLLKPFLYASALDDALIAPKQLLPDIPIFYKGFAPKNFDKKYRGAIPADQALVSSLNAPFVHLLRKYGYERFHQKLKNIGFYSLDKPAGHYGLSLILGGGESTLWELTTAYASMARVLDNYAERPYRSGYSQADYHANYYLKQQENSKPKFVANGLLRAPSIRFAFEAMQQVQRPDEETGWELFSSSRTIAWKTGTSFGFRDGWAIGLNHDYVVGVWIGNADGEGRPGLTGVRTAAPLMFQLFELLDGDAEFDGPFGSEEAVCKASGMRAGKHCQERIMMALSEELINTALCKYHELIHLDESERYQVNSSCYQVSEMRAKSWFVLPPVQAWYYKKYHPNYAVTPPFMPGCETNDDTRSFALIYPSHFARVHIPIEQDGTRGRVVFEAAHHHKDEVIYWHLNDSFLGTTKGTHRMGIQSTRGEHVLTLIDGSGQEVSQRFEIMN